MAALRIGFIIIAVTLSFCVGAAAPGGAGSSAYYYGQVASFSSDGRIPYGNTESAVKREILDDGARIVETVTQPGPSPSMRPKEIVTKLKRRHKTLVYDAADAGGTLAGTVTFQDPDLKIWTYDIELKAGGTIKGSGKLLPDGIKTEKHFSGGGRPMSVKEDLKAVSEREYRMRVGEMHPPKGAE